MAASPNLDGENEKDATLAQLQHAETELDLFKLSGDIDDALLDASLDEYQYGLLHSHTNVWSKPNTIYPQDTTSTS